MGASVSSEDDPALNAGDRTATPRDAQVQPTPEAIAGSSMPGALPTDLEAPGAVPGEQAPAPQRSAVAGKPAAEGSAPQNSAGTQQAPAATEASTKAETAPRAGSSVTVQQSPEAPATQAVAAQGTAVAGETAPTGGAAAVQAGNDIAAPPSPPSGKPRGAGLGIRVVGDPLQSPSGGARPDSSATPGASSAAPPVEQQTSDAGSQTSAERTASSGVQAEPSSTGSPASSVPTPGQGTPAVSGVAVTASQIQTASSSQAPVLATSAGMQDMIDSIRATIDLAARQGISQARIALQPAELGEIRVHLSQGAEGLIARVTAGSEAAAQALASGRAELHHSLSTIGTSLLRLDIGAFNQPGEGHGREQAGASGSASNHAAAGGDANVQEDETAETSSTEAAAAAPRGELVDVLA